MPAGAPRITFTPTPEIYDLLVRLSKTTGAPLSACTRDMMETLTDHLRMLVMVFEKTRSLNDGARQAAADAAADAEAVFTPLLAEAAKVMLKLATAFDEPPLPLEDRPPSSNTGVTNPAKAEVH